MSLRYFRKMGSMEQIFTIFHGNPKITGGWGPMVGIERITGLSDIALDKLQSLWNKIHAKYEQLQVQILTTPKINEYDDVYIGCLPFQFIKKNGMNKEDVHKLVVEELNHQYILLNDCNLTATDIKTGNYDITNIPPLYRIHVIDDALLLNVNHAIGDGVSFFAILTDFMCLLNGERFNDKVIPYTTIDECIDPKYASSAISRKISNLIPMSWALRFSKFYCNNSFLSKYNPLRFHRDDIIRFQFMYNPEMLQFPLTKYDRNDYRLDYTLRCLSKSVSLNIKKQCKLHNVHISSLLQYITNAAMIEAHNNILTKDYYKTVMNNVFSTIPMYPNPNKIYFGIHAAGYYTVIEYFKNIKINSDEFWKIIAQISDQVLNDDMITKVFQNKFPYMNTKKLMKYSLTDKDNLIGDRSMGGPTVTNPGIIYINKKHWKHKLIESYGAANPGVGMGAPYILGSGMIKGIDTISLCFAYGIQSISKDVAEIVVDKIKEKLEIVGSYRTNYQSKL